MQFNRRLVFCEALALALVLGLSGAFNHLRADTGACGGANVTLPFTDVAGNAFFCQIAAAYFAGLTNGTSATTFSPANNVTRDQMTAFITRTLDQSLKRGSRRAALGQHWTPGGPAAVGLTTVDKYPDAVAADGDDVWVLHEGNGPDGTVWRVSARDGRVLGSWTGIMSSAGGLLVALGRVFVTAGIAGRLYMIDPALSPRQATLVLTDVGSYAGAMAFDGARLWIATLEGVTIVTPGSPFTMQKVTVPGDAQGILYDGANIWVTTHYGDALQKLDANGSVIQTVTVGQFPGYPVFDGTNIWVPNITSDSVTVVRAATGTVLATLTGNGLVGRPFAAAFDGQRVLVTNYANKAVSLWKAADLSPLGSVGVGEKPFNACSDGLNFWILLTDSNSGAPGQLARF
jgi:hypothetical protein